MVSDTPTSFLGNLHNCFSDELENSVLFWAHVTGFTQIPDSGIGPNVDIHGDDVKPSLHNSLDGMKE
jgi:hypothetical protein